MEKLKQRKVRIFLAKDKTDKSKNARFIKNIQSFL